MTIILIALVILAIVSIVAMRFSSGKEQKEEQPLVLPDEECCGAHEVCEVDLKKLSEEIVYFEDEELDNYSGKVDFSYDDDAIEQFRDVLYTLRKPEISDWLHSLELRKVELPDILKPEVRMLLAE